MLTIENLPATLTALGFMAVGRTFTKSINGSTLDTSLDAGVIHYPEAGGLSVNERQTCSFSANESFVVLECVPPRPEQKRLVAKVRKLERQLAEAQAVIEGAPARNQAILHIYP